MFALQHFYLVAERSNLNHVNLPLVKFHYLKRHPEPGSNHEYSRRG